MLSNAELVSKTSCLGCIELISAKSGLLRYADPNHVCSETARQFLAEYYPTLADKCYYDAFVSKILSSNREYLVKFNLCKIARETFTIAHLLDILLKDLCSGKDSYILRDKLSVAVDASVHGAVHKLFKDIRKQFKFYNFDAFIEWLLGYSQRTIGNDAPYDQAENITYMITHRDTLRDQEIFSERIGPGIYRVTDNYSVNANFVIVEMKWLTEVIADVIYSMRIDDTQKCINAEKSLCSYLNMFSAMFFSDLNKYKNWAQSLNDMSRVMDYRMNLHPMDVLGSICTPHHLALEKFVHNTSPEELQHYRYRNYRDDECDAVRKYVLSHVFLT